MFSGIIGNEKIAHYLENILNKNQIPHSFLFSGPDGVGKSLFAAQFAKKLLAINQLPHPDVRFYKPEGKIGMHSIESMRQFNEEVYEAPYQSPYKVFIIHDAERMLTYSANALLKTFEEPGKKSIIILLSSNPDKLLPTILSRCYMLRFQGLTKEDIENFLVKNEKLDENRGKALANRSQGSLGKAYRMLREEDFLRRNLIKLLSKGKISTYSEVIKETKQIVDYLERQQEEKATLLKEELIKNFPSGLTTLQEKGLEKEIEGALSLLELSYADEIFDFILSWHRDMHLLQTAGDLEYFMNPDCFSEINHSFQMGHFKSLDQIQDLISKAKFSLERSTPLNHSLENLFLEIIF